MSIDRRSALVLIGAAAWAAKGEAFSIPASGHAAWFVDDGHDAGVLQQLGKHVYSEDGVPMFLACENVTGMPDSSPAAVEHALELNEKISAAFEHYAGQWQQQHPRAGAGDVAKIVEVLAERDFASGGQETSL